MAKSRKPVAGSIDESLAAPPKAWEPPDGLIVTDDRNYLIVVDGVRYEHVSEAPDGRWVYQRS